MERTKLKEARRAKGIAEKKRLTQADVADAIGCSVEVYSMWERGECYPQEHYRDKLLLYYGVKDPKELDLVPSNLVLDLGELITMLEQYDRREVFAKLQALQMCAGMDLLALLDGSLVHPEEHLKTSRVIIDESWGLLSSGSFPIAESILKACIPQLSSLAAHSSKYQHQAALLTVEAHLILMSIASHRLNYGTRELFGLEAVRLAELSKDSSIHVMALSWHANTYESCYHLPETAIAIYSDALPYLDDDVPLSKADICIGLAKAYALEKNETKAMDYIEIAKTTMPDDPELDPLYHCIRTGQAEMDQREARVYLLLAEYFPSNKNYPQMAYDAYERSIRSQPIDIGHRGETLVQKAKAAQVIGDFKEYIKCLVEGVQIALQFGSKIRINSARKALRKAPPEWRKEKPYQDLVKLLK